MKVVFEIEDTEVLQYGAMLQAVRNHFEKAGNENHLLDASIMTLQDVLLNAIMDQVTPERLKQMTSKG